MIEVLHDDDNVVVVVKPAGMPVHPSPGYVHGTLTETLVRSYPQMRDVGSVERPGVVHRLDIETSGVMVLAKTQRAYLELRRQFESHVQVRKVYLAVLHGAPKQRKGTCSEPIDGKPAISHWEVLARNGDKALVEFTIETGRTHQIRRHAKFLGHPIVGDRLYGDQSTRNGAARMLLHAVQLEFTHPISGRRMQFAAEPPSDIVFAR